MPTGVVVLARMDSRRLPGKVLRPLGGAPLIAHVIARAARIGESAAVVVATSDRAVDDAVAEAVEGRAALYRGAGADVARRCLDCAAAYGFARIVRISADSPFLDPALATRLVRLHRARGLDVATNVAPRTYPYGLSVEVLSTPALRRIVAEAESPADCEHVTPYVYRRPERFRLANAAAPEPGLAGVRLVVDTAADLARAAWIAARLGAAASTAPTAELVRLARAWDGAPDAARG